MNSRRRAYDIVLAPAAQRAVASMPAKAREGVSAALAAELVDGPNAAAEVRFGSSMWADDEPRPDDVVYTATPLSFGGHTAIHRPLTPVELSRRAAQKNEVNGRTVFYVIDVLSAESAFRPWPRVV
jgi:hypothetical protein